MERYSDAYCYVANWGTREFQLRFPMRALAQETVKPYMIDDRLELRQKGDYCLLTLRADDEEGYWELDRDLDEWLPGLTPVREDLMNGDLRALYLAWLSAAQGGFVDKDALEPHQLEALIVEDLSRYPDSAISEIHDRVGKEIPQTSIKRTLDALIERGKVVGVGERRWRRYRLA